MRNQNLFTIVFLIGLHAAPLRSAEQPGPTVAFNPTPADYAAAAKLLAPNLIGLVRNESVQPHWIGNSGRFWYRRDGQDGQEFVVVTAKGVKSPAFDHEGLARALYETLG